MYGWEELVRRLLARAKQPAIVFTEYRDTLQHLADALADARDRLPTHLRDPYHVTEAIQNYLYRDGGFVYRTDVSGMCTGEFVIDCFLAQKRGYCEYFASAMVMMLRSQQIPARYVLGYLPGKQQEEGVEHGHGPAFFSACAFIARHDRYGLANFPSTRP